MASATEKPRSPSSLPPPGSGAQLVDQHIERTRRALKLVDLTAGLLRLTLAVLAYLLVMAVLEHWVVAGGWSTTARGLLFGLLLVGVALEGWRTFWPLLHQSINPAYAAKTIEASSPSLKNSLLNFLLLRKRAQPLPQQVYQAIEQQAAQRLSSVPIDSAVDRSAIIRLGYLLVALIAIGVLYRLLSPKDLLASAGRVLMPWSEIATPSRVEISKLLPGDTRVARGESLSVTAEVLGLEAEEEVQLFYSTQDQQIVGQAIPMQPSAGGTQFSCQVPARLRSGIHGGIQQNLTYWIEAGDARSARYQVTLFERPTLVVQRLRYEYPSYTGYPAREVEHTGDLQAIEGTQVTLTAQANKPIQTAHVDFEADGRRDLLMHASDQQATVTFPLELREDRRTPRHTSYVLRYETTAGNQNSQPPQYQIEVHPDYAPEVELRLPAAALLEVALNQEVQFELEARDPDFALSQVALVGNVGPQQRLQVELLKTSQTGRFVGKLRKTPEQLGLQVGEVLEYWGVATDNRQPQANRTQSAHRRLRVGAPWQAGAQPEANGPQPSDAKNEPSAPQSGSGAQEGQAGGGEAGNSGEGEEGEQQGEGSRGQQGEPSEGDNQGQGAGDSQGSGQRGAHEGGSGDASEGGADPPSGQDQPESNQESNQESDQQADPGNSQGNRPDQEGVSPAGDDDGAAFEKIAKHFQQQTEESDQADQGRDTQSADSDGANSDGGSPDDNQTGDPADQQTPRTGDSSSGNQAQDRSAASDPQDPDQLAPDEEPGSTEDATEDTTEGSSQETTEDASEGQPGEAQSPQGAEDSATQGQDDRSSSEGSEGQAEDGQSSGDKSSEEKGAGEKGAGDKGAGDKGSGDKGSGDKGPGEPGSQQPADNGAGQSSEPGAGGQTGKQPGEQPGKQPGDAGASSQPGSSDQPSGEPGSGDPSVPQPGSGDSPSSPAEGNSGDNSDSNSDSAQGSDSGEDSGSGPDKDSGSAPQDSAPNEPQQRPADSQPDQAGESTAGPSGVGDPQGTGGSATAPPPGGELQEGDQANLEYARQQTDLILDRLEEQLEQQKVDSRLLEKLGWTEAELRRFVQRWKHLKAPADPATDSADNQALNDALRSLGLTPNRRTGYRSQMTQDQLRDLQDAYRGRVPLEYQEQVHRYLQGTANSQENE